MNKITKESILVFLIQALFIMPVFAIDLDYTIDDAIRKNYHLDKPISQGTVTPKPTPKTVSEPVSKQVTVEKTNPQPMPKLPAVPKSISASSPQKQVVKNISTQQKISHKVLPIRKGMSFDLVNSNAISDRQKVGTSIVFNAKKPIKTAYYTIPQGTKFVGKIVESHNPQFAGNGGLVSISITTIVLGGDYQHIDTTITKVGGKRVYFEKIKGKRTYLKNTVAKGKWGRRTFHKMNGVSSNLAKDKTTAILSPFTFVYGVALGGISTVTSPVVSIFSKGGSVSIPVNTEFRIKFNQDVNLYY